MAQKKICGVYKITNKINGKVYIGSSKNVKTRLKSHYFALKSNRVKFLMEEDCKQHGVDNFSFEILEECEQNKLTELEGKYIKMFDSTNTEKGYNIIVNNGKSTDKINTPEPVIIIENETLNWLKMQDICKHLGVGQRTIFNYIKAGMPAYKVGKAWRFDEKEVDEWIKTKKVLQFFSDLQNS